MAQTEYNRITAPGYAEGEIARRMKYLDPEIQKMLARIRADLNARGLFSASPVTRSQFGAMGNITGQVGQGVYSDIDERRMRLIDLLTQMEEMEKQRRAQKHSGLMGGLGGILGTVGGYMLNKFLPLPIPQFNWMGGDNNQAWNLPQLNTYGGSYGSGGQYNSGWSFRP